MKKSSLLISLLALLATSATAIESSVFVSAWSPKDLNTGMGGGISLSQPVGKHFEFSVRGVFFPALDGNDEANLLGLSMPYTAVTPSPGYDTTVSVISLGADASVLWPGDDRFTPYVGVGIGYYIPDVDQSKYHFVRHDNSAGCSLFTGTKVKLFGSWSCFVETRYTVARCLSEKEYGSSGSGSYVPLVNLMTDDTLRLSGFSASAGIDYAW